MRNARHSLEILAPAGGMESLTAAVRCGCDAVYLGGTSLNARRGAQNFDAEQLRRAVAYCHGRGVRVHMAVNTVVFGDELAEAELAVRTAAEAGVDALIIQDPAVARIARECAPDIQRHASTQMSVHNLQGVEALKRMGFTRAVLARELSEAEIRGISDSTDMELEAFVHGALCMCLSGGCYLSSMIGGRSGNRGVCAQPCRLPFASGGSEYALSLRDLSLVEQIAALERAGICSVKIEGRLKRPEYVAGAVTACRMARQGETPDMRTLEAVFSRSGFTDGYFTGRRGDRMFGTRRKEDVQAAAPALRSLAELYRNETPLVPVRFHLAMHEDRPAVLRVDDGISQLEFTGEIPQAAITAPTTPERVRAALEKTGGTPFFAEDVEADIGPGLMLPASQLNALRREALDSLLAIREKAKAHSFRPFAHPTAAARGRTGKIPALRVRLQGIGQYSPAMAGADRIIIPLADAEQLDRHMPDIPREKIILELPRVYFGDMSALLEPLERGRAAGLRAVLAGNAGGLELGRQAGFAVHGDFTLNCTNAVALEEFSRLGCADMTMSFECALEKLRALPPVTAFGAVAYGYLPLMVTRCRPAGMKDDTGYLTDRLGNRFRVEKTGHVHTLYNCVPLWLADRIGELDCLDFATLYFTSEPARRCEEVYLAYLERRPPEEEATRGLYYRTVQ